MKTFKKGFLLMMTFLYCQNIIAQDFDNLFSDFEKQGVKAAIYISQKEGSNQHEDYLAKDNSINEKTIFGIASVNKTITSVAVFKLIEEGKMKLNDPISKFYPEAPEDKKDITLKQLLSHTSGIADDFVMEGIKDKKEALNKLFAEKLLFKPGEFSKHQYSSDAYNLLAMIIEDVTGKKYEEYIRKTIFKPLKMKNSFFWEEVITNDLGDYSIAPLRSPIPEDWKSRNWGFVGSGGIFMNLQDLVKFSKVFKSNKILESSSLLQLMTPEIIINNSLLGKLGMAHGAFLGYHDNGSIEYISTGSEDFGHNAIIRYFPEEGFTVVVLTASIIDENKAGSKVVSSAIIDSLFY